MFAILKSFFFCKFKLGKTGINSLILKMKYLRHLIRVLRMPFKFEESLINFNRHCFDLKLNGQSTLKSNVFCENTSIKSILKYLASHFHRLIFFK